MDPTTAILVDGGLLMGFLADVVWTSLRVGAFVMVAPIIGTRSIPGRVRLTFMLALSTVLSRFVDTPTLGALDAVMVLNVIREMAIGIALGFTLRVAFEAAALAGELVAQGMALAFAQLADPLRGGATSGVVGLWFYIAFVLLFLAFDGHLAMINLIVESYRQLPVGMAVPEPVKMISGPPRFLAVAFLTGVGIALPIMMAMLVVNLAFGVLGRAAPALNPIAVGLPAALATGMVLMSVVIAELMTPARRLFDAAFAAALALLE